MRCIWVTCVAVILITYLDCTNASGYRLFERARYFVAAPKIVRPNTIYEIHVAVFKLGYASTKIRASLIKDNMEYASATDTYASDTSRSLQLRVPNTVTQGRHILRVEGLVHSKVGDRWFRNETRLTFKSKHVSLFIQTSRPVYYQDQTVLFRILGISPDLRPIYGTMTIYILDANRNVVWRWLQQQLNMGMFQGKFKLNYPFVPGKWTVQVDAFGHIYEETFLTQFYYKRRYEVNVTTPIQILDSDWGLTGTIYGEHMSGAPFKGNATVVLTAYLANGNKLPGSITRRLNVVDGERPFDFSMVEMENTWGKMGGKQLKIEGYAYDWRFMETQNGTSFTDVLVDGIELKLLGNTMRTFKPNEPFIIYIGITRSDGSPFDLRTARAIRIQRIHTNDAGTLPIPLETVVIPDDSIIRYQVDPKVGDKKIVITATHPSMSRDKVQVTAYVHYSRNYRHYLTITSSTEKPTVNEYMVFTLATTALVPKVNYMIVAGNRIWMSSVLFMQSRQKSFSIALSRHMSPRARLIAYYNLPDGDIIAGALNFYVDDPKLSSARLTVNAGKDFSGNTVELIGKSDPGSFMATTGLDYDLYHKGGHTFLTKEKVVRELETYDEPCQGPHEHLWYYDDDRWEQSVYFNAPSSGVDANTTFELAGLVVLTDANVSHNIGPEYAHCNATRSLAACVSGLQCYQYDQRCDGNPQCDDGTDEVSCPLQKRIVPRGHKLDNHHMKARHFTVADWVWRNSYVKPDGYVQLKVNVPEDPNPWVMSMFSVHPVEGLALLNHPVQHDATRLFYMVVEGPTTARLGEQIGLRVALFNYWDQVLEVLVMLHDSDQYKFLHVEDYGWVNHYRPRMSRGDVQTLVYIEANSFKYVHMPVAPVQTGEITVKLSSYTPIAKDTENFVVEVVYDGVTVDYHTPYTIDLVNQGAVIIPDMEIVVPQLFVYPEQNYHVYVPGSPTATVSIFGDVAWPGFFMDPIVSDEYIGIPHDTADGYIFDFAATLQTLKLLEDTNALKQKQKRTALESLRTMLMRQYAYMDNDGGFRLFRRTLQKSVWVTAHVLTTLHEMVESVWSEDVYIPISLLNKITLWLSSRQNKTTGVFIVDEPLYNRNMQPVTVDKNGKEYMWYISYTALCTISLGSVPRLTGPAKVAADEAVGLAAQYLASKMNFITDPYQMALTTYALWKARHAKKLVALDKLKKMKRVQDNHVYWSATKIDPNPTKIVDTVPYLLPRDDYENLGNAVEATSYALMLYIANNEWSNSAPIMKWLQHHRAHNMGFSSTQDTIVAMKALREYVKGETNRDIYQMEITLESTSTTGWKKVVSFNKNNYDKLHQLEIPNVWGTVKATARGTGYATMRLFTEKNVEREFQVDNPPFKSFDVQIPKMHFWGKNSSIMDMSVCIKWIRPDLAVQSGLTVLYVSIPTGFEISREVIEGLYLKQIPGLKRVRFRGGQLYFFYEQVSQNNTCAEFRAERWYPVANGTIQHAIGVYEYYEVGLFRATLYTTYTLFSQHICQVCGSFQCPYCPFYNTAALPAGPSPLTLLPGLIVSLAIAFFSKKLYS